MQTQGDSIEFKFISGGDANAGNGGNGYSSGPVGNGNTQNLTINPYNKADGSVDYNTGDKFVQKGPTGQWVIRTRPTTAATPAVR